MWAARSRPLGTTERKNCDPMQNQAKDTVPLRYGGTSLVDPLEGQRLLGQEET